MQMNAAQTQDSPSMRLARLRAAMQAAGVAAVIVPSSDPHMSEYPPAHWATREWLSGFNGSVGTVVVTGADAGLWVDSRYWEQAERQLAGSGIGLQKQGAPGTPPMEDWLAARLAQADQVAVDGAVLAWSEAKRLREAFVRSGITLRTDLDLTGPLWQQRPPLPANLVFEQPVSHAGEARQAKLERLRQRLSAAGADSLFLSGLDDIAWLFNLRGDDVPYNPVFVAHAQVDTHQARLFIDEAKLPAGLRDSLRLDGVLVEPAARAAEVVAAMQPGERLLIDPDRCAARLVEAIPAGVNRVEATSPVVLMKCRKNACEQAHVRDAMAHDGAALCRFMSWFDQAHRSGQLSELDVVARVRAERAANPGFISESFGTISAFNPNAALPHYRAEPATAARIEGNGLLLLDSGGQYQGATTDITRMLPVGEVSAEQKRDCALVLRAMIALSRAAFPAGIGAPMVDAIARAPMWAEGVDYGHGTGHGVGCFLHVHEGPQSIACHARPRPHNTLEEGMITSIEPGIYRPGLWGVRIENLVLASEFRSTAFGRFLHFETLTLCPIDLRCIDTTLLKEDEIAWLDAYHQEVRRRLDPLLGGEAREWMRRRTAPVGSL
ncbi:M24 family metallopeptidase [Uliginosibacterium paludis]|uniref:Aminopeptidase P family protein n=1 Tax=Uliginosibacterium paludis TaxID=1615952 RepID=A0ABV2CPM3_9RHOO